MSRVRLLFRPPSAALHAALLIGATLVGCRPGADPGPEVHLEIRTQPTNVAVGAAMPTPFVIEVLDRSGDLTSRAGMTVRAQIQPGTGQLAGNIDVAVVGGVATFTDMVVLGAANRSSAILFQLYENGLATAGSVVTSSTFTMSAGPAAVLAPQSQVPASGTPGEAVPAPSVIVRDAGGNALPGVPVTFAVIAGEGVINGATEVTTDAQGVASISGWVLGLPGTNQLRASVSATTGVTFTVNVTSTTGMLRIRATGQPQGAPVRVRVQKTSAAGTVYDVIHTVIDSLTITGLQFGTYQVTGDSVNVGSRIWLANANFTGLNVSSTSGPSVGFTYREVGRFEITTRGLPGPTVSAILDFQPVSTTAGTQLFSVTVLNDAVTRGLGLVGAYDLVPRVMTIAGQQYAATPARQSISIDGGASLAQATVTYAVITGTLIVDLVGLPQGAAPLIDVSGPGGFRETVFFAGSRTWNGLVPGTYTVTAAPITVNGTVFNPAPSTSQTAVTAGATARVTITYN